MARSRLLAVPLLAALALAALGPAPVQAAPVPGVLTGDARLNSDVRVERLMRRMTLQEKIGQMVQLNEGSVLTGPGGTANIEGNIREGNAGSVLNAVGIERVAKLQHIAVEQSRLHIPLIFGLDVIHGYRTIFPIPLAEACSWDLGAMELSAQVGAREASADGVNWTFAPMVDIARDPRWGRIAEGGGEDVYLSSQIAAARVRGFQGPDLRARDRVVACLKHFAAYGAAQAGRDYNTVDLSQRSLLETYLPPYRAAVRAGCLTAMSSFNEYDGVPATGNHYLLDTVLKQQWGFRGFVVSDWESVTEMIPHGVVANRKDAARLAANAGLDMDMQSGAYLQNLSALVREGKVSSRVVDEACRRVLRVKFAKGLFDDPYQALDAARAKRELFSTANRAAARDVAKRSLVLLENRKQVLPLAPGKHVALVGPLAGSRPDMLGTWASQGDGAACVSVLDALQERGVKVAYAKGCEVNGESRTGFDAALAAAKAADVVVAVLGEAADMSGEASSRSEIGLPGVQRELLAKLVATGKPVVLVLMNGRPLTLSWEQAHLDTILEAWHLGTEAGHAACDVLYGDYNPAGKLVNTFPRAVGQIPLFYDHMNTGRPYSPTDHYTTHYMDLPNDPVYPFGYGLSYTRFTYSGLSLSTKTLAPRGKVGIDVTVSNVGDRDGEEVAQLYIRDLVGSVSRPVKQLKGFQKVMIPKHQSRRLHFELTPKDLAFHQADMRYGAEAGEFKVWVGSSSETGSEGHFRLTQDVTVQE